MNKILLVVIAILATIIVAKPAGAYDFNQAWRYLWQASNAAAMDLRVENGELQAIADTVPVLEESLAAATVQLDEQQATIEAQAAKIADLIPRAVAPEKLQNIRNSIDDLSERLVTLRVRVSKQNALLSKAITKILWIDTAYGVVTTRRFACCGSMEPYIGSDDLVLVLNNPPPEIIGRGDVIGSSNPSCGYTHRIIDGNATEGWITKGDNRYTIDDCRVTKDQILFRVEYVIKGFYS